MASITRYLEKVLKVKVNTDKSKVVQVQDCSFLGFTFKGKKLTATVKAVTTFKNRLRRLTGRSWGISMQDRYGHIRLYVRGWMNYFGIGMRYTDISGTGSLATTADQDVLLEAVGQGAKTDWRTYKARVSEVSGDTDGPEQERATGILPRRMRPTAGCQRNILQDQGLVSLRTLWIGIHYPATAR